MKEFNQWLNENFPKEEDKELRLAKGSACTPSLITQGYFASVPDYCRDEQWYKDLFKSWKVDIENELDIYSFDDDIEEIFHTYSVDFCDFYDIQRRTSMDPYYIDFDNKVVWFSKQDYDNFIKYAEEQDNITFKELMERQQQEVEVEEENKILLHEEYKSNLEEMGIDINKVPIFVSSIDLSGNALAVIREYMTLPEMVDIDINLSSRYFFDKNSSRVWADKSQYDEFIRENSKIEDDVSTQYVPTNTFLISNAMINDEHWKVADINNIDEKLIEKIKRLGFLETVTDNDCQFSAMLPDGAYEELVALEKELGIDRDEQCLDG